jgi:hypothetical protein
MVWQGRGFHLLRSLVYNMKHISSAQWLYRILYNNNIRVGTVFFCLEHLPRWFCRKANPFIVLLRIDVILVRLDVLWLLRDLVWMKMTVLARFLIGYHLLHVWVKNLTAYAIESNILHYSVFFFFLFSFSRTRFHSWLTPTDWPLN